MTTKRIKAQTKIEPGKTYAIDDALKIVKDNSKAKFVEAVDVAVRLGVDAKKSDQQVRGSTVLPAGTGKSVRVAVFAPAGAKVQGRVTVVEGRVVLTASYTQPRLGASGRRTRVTCVT